MTHRPALSDSDTWLDLHSRLQRWADCADNAAASADGVLCYLQCEITQSTPQILKGHTIRQDAELANAVLLDLLRTAWVGKPLNIVTHDFCNDDVLDALVSRNIIVAPSPSLVSTRGSCIFHPDELKLCEELTSSNGRHDVIPRSSAPFFVTFQPDTALKLCRRPLLQPAPCK